MLLGTTGVLTASATPVMAATPTVSSAVVQVMKQQKPVMTTNAKPATNVKLVIDGVERYLQDPMMEENGRVFLPIREVSGLLGINVDYLEKEKVALASNQQAYLELPLGYNQAVKDKSVILPIDANNKNTRIFTYKSRTYLPLRFVAENLGIEISYSNRTVTINTGNSGTVTPKPDKPTGGLYDLSGMNAKDPNNALNKQALQDGRSLYNAPAVSLSELKKPEGMDSVGWNNLINLNSKGVLVNAKLSELPDYINYYDKHNNTEHTSESTMTVPDIYVKENGNIASSGRAGAPVLVYYKDGTFANASDGSDISNALNPHTGARVPNKQLKDVACITICDTFANSLYIVTPTGK